MTRNRWSFGSLALTLLSPVSCGLDSVALDFADTHSNEVGEVSEVSVGDTSDAGAVLDGCPSMCNGRCVDLQWDPANCGTCGTSCDNFHSCSSGKCTCESGLTDCSGNCVDTQSDYQHCGTCGTVCGTGLVCSKGACVSACASGLTNCKRSCVNLKTDSLHCGECDDSCEGISLCVTGTCVTYGLALGCTTCPCPSGCAQTCCPNRGGEALCVYASSCP